MRETSTTSTDAHERWDDPLVDAIRPAVREAIETALEQELQRQLGAARYVRVAA